MIPAQDALGSSARQVDQPALPVSAQPAEASLAFGDLTLVDAEVAPDSSHVSWWLRRQTELPAGHRLHLPDVRHHPFGVLANAVNAGSELVGDQRRPSTYPTLTFRQVAHMALLGCLVARQS